jgi:pyruvate formate lyase activating enzyme
MDSEKHRRYTGVPNEQILENIRRIAKNGHPFVIRIPLIDGINADEKNIDETAIFLNSLPQSESLVVHLLPYHDVGRDKHRRMWSSYNPQHVPMEAPSEELQQKCRRQLEAHGLRVIVGG